ncbi:DNA methyltransferase [Prevotella sp. P6B4]|jgi:adenine-specific DNA-methyltransferase|uniref:DNA methyltransferase n=1 Tax=Prevotella sp. P6B4 TaxID=1410614 RepID=UPI00048D783D|nr:site-specific DNA-methyltransferase [Prevotella sp. P6B4]
MNQHYEAFRKKLQEIFMMDHAELDFGIYRIMNHKRNQINDFLDNQLLPQVEQTLKEYVKTDDSLQQELTKAIEGCKNLGIDPDTNPKVQQLRQQIAQSSTGIDDLQNTVFSRLTQFFSRYYEGGDFVSQRRYKTGGNSAYAIPYNGEEVKLYWANYDQYYIKTSEYFKNYTFKLRDGRRIFFVLVDASTEQNNNKSTEGMERRFDVLRNEEGLPVFEEMDDEFHISFTYELMMKPPKQEIFNKNAFEALSVMIPKSWQDLLVKENVTDKVVLLEKHIKAYTDKNSFDYFIHKDLGGFLSRELDFYIKNEVFVIADLDAAKLQSQLAVVKAIERVGQKIIDFLAQLENFQKRLWLKKKFVVQSDYCITLDRVPEKYYPEICANDEQRKEWVRLFAIDEIKGDMMTEAYCEPLTIEFLKQNPLLVLDTKFFSLQFKHKLLADIEGLDEQTNGLLIKSENLQAINLLTRTFSSNVRGCYIDPPFNLGENADYLYRVDYKDSTWLTLLYDRVLGIKKLLMDDGSIFVRCSHDGNMILRQLLNQTYGQDNYRNEIVLRRAEETKGDLNKQFGTIKSITVNYDNLYWYSKYPNSRFSKIIKPISAEKSDAHWHSFWKALDRPTMRYEILGIDLSNHYGQWMWEKNRAFAAVKNYEIYQEQFEPKGISLEDYWVQTGKSLEFVKRDGDKIGSIKYWIPPRTETMADTNWLDIKGYANKWGFKTENSEGVLKRVIDSLSEKDDYIIDCFLGSGTTAAVALKLQRKFIGIDMGDHISKIAYPRLKYVLNGEKSGISNSCTYRGGGCFKYIRLEQYEDTLNNLEVNDGFGKPDNESYVLRYMLDTETRDSLINTKDFVRPFDYTIKTTRDNELVDTPVDLVDTFNYLIGLHVDSIHWHKDDNICVVEGTTHIEKEHALVIWRNQDVIKNDDLNDFFRKQDYSTLDREFDVIYVNGDNTLPNLKSDEEHWKVRLIEQELMKRMFEEE